MTDTWDVFFSYARPDSAAVQPFVAALEKSGLRVFIDEQGVERFESITKRIQEGLGRSKVLVAYYTAIYPTRAACQWELTAAYVTGQAEGDPYRRVLVLNPEDDARHIQPAELADARFAEVRDTGDAPDVVAAAVAVHLADIPGTLAEIHPLEPSPCYPTNLVHRPRFVGRIREMWKVHQALSRGRLTPITGRVGPSTTQLSGLGGIGKTVLAEEYALRFQYAYPGGIYWLRAGAQEDGGETREHEFRSIAEHLGLDVHGLLPNQVHAVLRNHFDRNAGSALWIVDDLPVGVDDKEFQAWQGPGRYCQTLMTTRGTAHNVDRIDLDVLTEDEALELLLSFHRTPRSDDEMEQARGLVRDLGRHALACEVTGALLATGAYSIAKYRLLLASPSEDALRLSANLKGVLPHDHEASIAATLLQSIDALGTHGSLFLQIAAVLGPFPFSANLVRGAFEELTSESDGQQGFAEGVSEVLSHSLCQRIDADVHAYRVHNLVSHVVRHHRQAGDREKEMRSAVNAALLDILQEVSEVSSHPRIEYDMLQARSVYVHEPTAPVGRLIGRYDFERGNYRSARESYAHVVETLRRGLGEEHPDTLESMNTLAAVLLAKGQFVDARQYQEQVVKTRERVLGEEHPDTLTSVINLARMLFAQGHLTDARRHEEQTLEVLRRVLGEEHPLTLIAMSNLAGTLKEQGDVIGARKYQEKVFEIRRRVLGTEHPDTLTSIHNVAQTLKEQGELTEARKLQEQTLETLRRVLGEEHPHTLTTMGNLAGTLRAQGDLTGARRYQEKVFEALRRVLGEEHPHTLTAMGNLAGTLKEQGDVTGARDLIAKARAIAQRTLEPTVRLRLTLEEIAKRLG